MKLSRSGIMYIFITVFPIIPYYFEIFGISFSNIIAVLTLMILFLMSRMSVRREDTIIKTALPWLLWVLSMVLCNVVKGEMQEGIFILMRMIAIYLCVTGSIKSKDTFLKALHILVVTYGIVGILGVIEGITRMNAFSFLNTMGVDLNYNPLRFGVKRILGFASQTIVYGIYISFGLGLCLYMLQMSALHSRKRNLYLTIYILLWFNLFLTLSRSAILCALLSQGLMLYFMGMRKLLFSIIKVLVGICAIYFFCSLVFPDIAKAISNVFYMLLAVFNYSYADAISSAFGNDNLYAVGNRLDLYNWVADSMDGHWLFGQNSAFNYAVKNTDGFYTWTTYKASIEVEYLSSLYNYGLIGLIFQICFFISLIKEGFKKKSKSFLRERNLSFNAVCLSLFISYFMTLFAVNQSSERNMFLIIVMLFISYNKFSQFDDEVSDDECCVDGL